MPKKNNTSDLKHKPCDDCPTKEVGFFCSVDDEIINTINHIKVTKHYKAGEAIYLAGSHSEGLYSIRTGVVKLENITEQGQSSIINIIGPGGLLGYRSFFADEKHSSSARAVEDCQIYFLPGKKVSKLFNCHQELIHKIVAQLSEDSKLAETKWLNQINKGAPARVAEALIFLAEKFHHTRWTRNTIADWSGTSPETVIRSLALFEKEGLISKNYSSVTILKPELLLEKSLS